VHACAFAQKVLVSAWVLKEFEKSSKIAEAIHLGPL
jgi:hypothetical protein